MASFDNGYALVVGVANYPTVRKLPVTVLKDATDISALLTNTAQCGYPPGQVRRLLDEQATADNIRTELRWLAERTGEDDTAVFFFSGHGGRIESGSQAENYLIPYDTDPAHLQKTAIEGGELTDLLREIKAGRLLVLFDCCHAGGTGETKGALDESIPKFKSGLDERYYDRLATGQGRVIIASSRSDELSWILPGVGNSLFTHYLLEALRGQARTYGDGWIGVLDVFNFIADEVPKRQPQQHPILKAELETNFPIALHFGGRQLQSKPSAKPTVENPKNLSLPAEAESILNTMFADYRRVVVEREFRGGFSGGRVFLVRPIRGDGLPELPAVVKMASVSLIQKEWGAYQDCIRDRLPHSIGVRGMPVFPPGSGWGALRYPLVGSGTFEIESLRSYGHRASLEDIRFVLEERLLKIIEEVMQYNRFSPAFYLHSSYDHVLPVNLLVKPASAPPGTQLHVIKPSTSRHHSLEQGSYVRPEGFVVTKVDLQRRMVTLNLPSSTDGPPASYSIRLQSMEAMASYQVNQVIDPVEGVVIETRQERLQAEAQRALGPGFNLTDEMLISPDGTKLPNPLLALPRVLSEYRDVKVGCIHGDLNLENILVDPATRDVTLIDFAAAREDHLLHDFLRLETEIVIKLIPETLARANLAAGTIHAFYEQLHQAMVQPNQSTPSDSLHPALKKPFVMLLAIRKKAHRYLFKPDDWGEYYQGLVLYLLGALKFRNLNEEPVAPLPKQVAFWSAATVVDLLERPPSPPEIGRPMAEFWPPTLPWNEPYYQLPDRDIEIEGIVQHLIKKEERWGAFVSGLGGIGKTATAIEIGRRCLAAGAFERVLGDTAKIEFLIGGRIARSEDRSALNFEGFLNELGTQLDRPDLRLKPLAEKRQILQRLLSQATYLVIVDNLETTQNAEQIVRDLPPLLGRSRALVTSREVVPATTIPLNLKDLSEADTLFFLREDAQLRQCEEIAKAPDTILGDIYQTVGGQPLALKLIVGQVANFGLDEALENIQNARGDIYSFIYWDSWQKLSPTAQQVLIQLGRKPASISLKSLRYTFSDTANKALLSAIEQLIDLSLVNIIHVGGGKRYSIHEMTRRFINSDLPRAWQQSDSAQNARRQPH